MDSDSWNNINETLQKILNGEDIDGIQATTDEEKLSDNVIVTDIENDEDIDDYGGFVELSDYMLTLPSHYNTRNYEFEGSRIIQIMNPDESVTMAIKSVSLNYLPEEYYQNIYDEYCKDMALKSVSGESLLDYVNTSAYGDQASYSSEATVKFDKDTNIQILMVEPSNEKNLYIFTFMYPNDSSSVAEDNEASIRLKALYYHLASIDNNYTQMYQVGANK